MNTKSPVPRVISLAVSGLFWAILVASPVHGGSMHAKPVGGETSDGLALRSPVRLAVAPNGDLFVSDYRLMRILTIDRDTLEVVRGIPVGGRPLGVAYARGHLYVGNETKKRVEIYSRGGDLLRTLGNDTVIKQPTDIAIDASRRLVFVVDNADKAVKVFSMDGPMLYAIPNAYPDPDVLASPTGITLDLDKQEVYVSDFGDPSQSIKARVQVFDYGGTLVDTIKSKKGGMGMFGTYLFSRPQGLALDGLGHVFVVDSYSGEVLAFNRATGDGVKTLGGHGEEPGEMRLPLDIVMDPRTKDLFVTNNRCRRIEMFRGGGLIP